MLNAYENWYTRRNWYALYIAIVAGTESGTALKAMGAYNKFNPEKNAQRKPRKLHSKYPEELVNRAFELRANGMKWHDIADTVGINYGSLMSIYTKRKREEEKRKAGEIND